MVRRRRQEPDHSIERIAVIPVGSVERPIVDYLNTHLARILGKRVEAASPIEDPSYAYNKTRRQYLAEAVLLKLAQIRDSLKGRLLGITGVDLYLQDGSSAFGHASQERKVALVSMRRLRDEYYGLPANVEKLEERVLKEAVRQLGLTYGLRGCKNPLCTMFNTRELFDLDIKRPFLCSTCRRAIR